VGEIVQEYERSAYIELAVDDRSVLGPPLVLLCGTGFDGPLSTRIAPESGAPFRELGVAAGDRCRLRAATTTAEGSGGFVLSVGKTLEVSLRAEALRPAETPAVYGDVRAIGRDSDAWARCAELARWLADRDVEDGLCWAPDLTATADGQPPSGELKLLAESWADALAGQRRRSSRADVELGVLGRGPGTTPSGDDVLSGVLLVLHGVTRGQTRERVRWLGERVVSAAAEQTTAVSTALIAQAAQGRASERAERLVRSLFGSSGTDYERAAADLIQVGHTSGTDLLIGILVAGLLICPLVG
jgi:hypothetical protein